MSHAVTIGGLLLGLGAVAGFLATLLGLLAVFAAGMSDSVNAGKEAERTGYTCMIVGVLVFGACLLGLIT